ncbi:phage virion morphogenesis protein [Paludibacterium paludis]|uniref:Virion morphogenesis protein n=1 Tax=Paludibacterium paludis TaxID=1225769 RepID=A0A918NX88_9NEIS|nr:phage virion morphogenesis protein [Paludibacterium paludis]GGY03807.1 virion morphogenesis protein [Paludibacterium paludis]
MTRYEDELSGLLMKLSPPQRRKLAREIATALRRETVKRIAAQENPDGSPMDPRKPQLRSQKGRIRRSMFAKLRTAKYLKTDATPNKAVVGFVARVERIARVHQEGLRDRVRPDGPTYQYPRRQLLGFADESVAMVSDRLLNFITK